MNKPTGEKGKVIIPAGQIIYMEEAKHVKWSKDRKTLHLYNKNGFKWQKFSTVTPLENRLAYKAEYSRLDPYFNCYRLTLNHHE